MSNDTLMPCPCCNGPVELKQTGKTQITVRCRRCCLARVQKWLNRDYNWLAEKQIEAWNTRHWLTVVDEMIEEKEEEKQRHKLCSRQWELSAMYIGTLKDLKTRCGVE